MKRVILLGLVTLGAWAASTLPAAEAARPTSCAAVLCAPCPAGFRLLFKPNNCCRCVPFPQGG
jgi:hypothetical protein